MANPNIDYTITNFEYPVLTKIHGIPKSILKIKNKMKENAASVPCDLGGGAHVHLGIMLTRSEYANISVVDYVRPVHLGILNIPVGITSYETTRLTSKHKELLRVNRETNNVEACLLKQLGKVLPELCLKSFRNEYSNTFNTDLQTILLLWRVLYDEGCMLCIVLLYCVLYVVILLYFWLFYYCVVYSCIL